MINWLLFFPQESKWVTWLRLSLTAIATVLSITIGVALSTQHYDHYDYLKVGSTFLTNL